MKPRRSPLSKKQTEDGFDAKILRLVTSAPERRAIRSGEIDAIIDPNSGHVILLPDAQAELLAGKARFRSLVELSTDGYWEQDEHFRFVAHTGAAIGNVDGEGASILGKTLWELQFDNGDQIDWQTHRTQLQWRAIFRDLELQCVDSTGRRHIISISGEPVFAAEIFKGYRGITRELADREQVQIASESDRFTRSILDTVVTQICVLNAAGTVIKCNTAWRVLGATHRGRNADFSEGSNYLALCAQIDGSEQVEAAAMIAGIRQVIAGERELFRYEYYCDLETPRWFMANVVRMRGDDAGRAVVSFEDITGIKDEERLLRLECAVARLLSEADGAASAVQAVMQAICEAQRWDCGQYFQLNPSSETLSLKHSWGKPTTEVAQFLERSQRSVFRSGAGLAGRVCQSNEPLWLHTKSTNASVQALAHEVSGARIGADENRGSAASMGGAFVFPVTVSSKSIGVLAFASHTVLEPDDRLLRSVRSIGDQVGRFLLREHSAAALRQNELRFRRLTELSSDWIWEQDSDCRFTKLAGSGMSGMGNVLGKTLWELPIVLSDEEWIKHKSELQARWSFCDFEYETESPDGRRHRYRISGEPLYDANDVFCGFHGTGLDITDRQFDAGAAVELEASAIEA